MTLKSFRVSRCGQPHTPPIVVAVGDVGGRHREGNHEDQVSDATAVTELKLMLFACGGPYDSDVNKDFSRKDQDKDFSYKDKDQDFAVKDKDQDLIIKEDQDKDKDFGLKQQTSNTNTLSLLLRKMAGRRL